MLCLDFENLMIKSFLRKKKNKNILIPFPLVNPCFVPDSFIIGRTASFTSQTKSHQPPPLPPPPTDFPKPFRLDVRIIDLVWYLHCQNMRHRNNERKRGVLRKRGYRKKEHFRKGVGQGDLDTSLRMGWNLTTRVIENLGL